MLSRDQIDQIEAVLFNATLQDVPRVFGKVLPILFAELRVMQGALDKQAEEFFSHDQARPHGGGATQSGSNDQAGSGLLAGAGTVSGDKGHFLANLVAADNRERSGGSRTDAAGGSSPDARCAGAVAGGGLESAVGGEVRRRKRGRPPKSRQPVDAGLTEALPIQPSPKITEEN